MIKPGAVVVDFGTTPQNSSLVGDVDFAAAQGVAGAITPVPGGVGPVTVAVLARSVVRAAEGRASAASG
jgi:methylenetetrahydrofolate dehydrogenase (NADP+)/methenyltetrahydrofolate cyclohydrolase